MAETIVPVAGDVKGDITACKVETIQKSVERGGSLSLTQKENYMTYNVCTKEVVAEYSNQAIAGGGWMLILAIPVILFVAFTAMMASDF